MQYVRRSLAKMFSRQLAPVAKTAAKPTYETLYESYAQATPTDDAVGDGDFALIGRIELDLLLMEGLKPNHTLVDFGCGHGRLAVQAIPLLVGGCYIGIDISESFLKRGAARIRKCIPAPPCQVAWVKQTTPNYPLDDKSVDIICAFSVFTHMEHEDSYLYLKEAARVVRPGGRFIFSCLPINLKCARDFFVGEASLDLQTRWGRVRNITTSIDMMNEVAQLAGWKPVRWYAGDQANIRSAKGEMRALGQSCCVLQLAKE